MNAISGDASLNDAARSGVVERVSLPSLRLQLLLVVNVILGIAISVLLAIDYRKEIDDAIINKHVSLEDEAIAIHRAVQHLYRGHGTEDVQEYIDNVCVKMRDKRSPGHNIAVRIDGRVFQSSKHGQKNPEMFKAMQAAHRAHNHRARLGGETLIVGSFGENGVFAFVSEYMTNIRRSIRYKAMLRLLSLTLLAIAAAVIVNLALLTLVATPLNALATTVKQVADGQFGIQVGRFTSRELQQLANAVNSMSSELAEVEERRIQQMTKAREIQEHLLPGEANIPGMSVDVIFSPTEDVGGDYYDFIELPGGSWLICIADVTGHGVPAAMEAAILKTILLQAVEHCVSPSEILTFINHRFVKTSLPEYFASMFLARWQPSSKRFEYASAGHEPGFLLDPDQHNVQELTATGLFLGIDPSDTWDTESFHVLNGSRLLLVTDGASQMCNEDNQMFGLTRLRQLFVDSSGNSSDRVVGRIHEELQVYRHSQAVDDDLTLVLLEFGPTQDVLVQSIIENIYQA